MSFLHRPHDYLRTQRESRHRTPLVNPAHYHTYDSAVGYVLALALGFALGLLIFG